MGNLLTPIRGGCCGFIKDVQSGRYPVVDPAPIMRLFWTTVTTGGGFDDFDAGSFGSTVIAFGSGQNLADWLQTNVTPDSGASLDNGDGQYAFWILAESAPTDWTWNDVPISFTDDGVASLKCFDTGAFAALPDVSRWTQLILVTTMGLETNQSAPDYGDAGFINRWQTYAIQLGGIGAVGTAVINAADVTLRVDNTYLTWISNISIDGLSNQQTDNFSPC